MKAAQLTPKQKVAALLLAFGHDLAAEVFRHLSHDEAKSIAGGMQQLASLSPQVVDEVLMEFYELLTRQPTLQGGAAAADRLLAKSFGKEQAATLSSALGTASPRLDSIAQVDAATLAKLISKEHPQTIALILAFCDPQKCGQVLKRLPAEQHAPLLLRLANLDRVSSETLEDLDSSLRSQLSKMASQAEVRRGGVGAVAAMLSKMDKEGSERLLEALGERDDHLAKSVREGMLTFEDLRNLNARDWQEVMKHTADRDWLVALKLASDELKALFFGQLSSRRATRMQEDLAALPAMRKVDVEAMQRQLLSTVTELAGKGLISLGDETV